MCKIHRMTFYSFIIIMILTTSIFTSQQIREQQLYNAIKHGLLDDASTYLKQPDLNFDFIDAHDDKTCLECAIIHGRAGIVHGLLQKNIDVNLQCNLNRETPLHQAVYTQDVSIVGLLLQHKDIDPDRHNMNSITPLQLASLLGYAQVADMIRNHRDLQTDQFSTFSTIELSSDTEELLLDEQKDKEKCLWFWWMFSRK